jgi:hypothetical protein
MKRVRIVVEPGICGFSCQVEARKRDKHHADIEIVGSECELIRKMAENLIHVTRNDIFAPHTGNPVFKAAEKAGCHLTCPIPVAVLKAAEAALDLALPCDVRISFMQNDKKVSL